MMDEHRSVQVSDMSDLVWIIEFCHKYMNYLFKNIHEVYMIAARQTHIKGMWSKSWLTDWDQMVVDNFIDKFRNELLHLSDTSAL